MLTIFIVIRKIENPVTVTVTIISYGRTGVCFLHRNYVNIGI